MYMNITGKKFTLVTVHWPAHAEYTEIATRFMY